MFRANLCSSWLIAVILALAGLVGGCGGSTQTVTLPTITAHVTTSASVDVTGRVTSGCGHPGGCAYFGRLSSTVQSTEGSQLLAWTDWAFDASALPELCVGSNPFPAGLGPGTGRLEARMHPVLAVGSDGIPQLGSVAASCSSNLTVPADGFKVVIRATFDGAKPCRIETEIEPSK